MNAELIARVRDAMKYDLRELDEVFGPLLRDVLFALEHPGVPAPHNPVGPLLMLRPEQTEGDGLPTSEQVVEDARRRMEALDLRFIANARLSGDREEFTVASVIPGVTSTGFVLSEILGSCTLPTAAEVIMLHLHRNFDLSFGLMEDARGDLRVTWDRTLSRQDLIAVRLFLTNDI